MSHKIRASHSKQAAPPGHVDPASWALIQQLQEKHADDQDDEVIVISESSLDAESAKRLAERRQQGQRDYKRQRRQEQESYAVALQLQLEYDHSAPHQVSKLPEDVIESLDANTARKAFRYAQARAKEQHEKVMKRLQARVKKLGFEDTALDECLGYIRDDAPIIIHLKEETLRLLVRDTHYRNLFETGKSGGTSDKKARALWEKHLFGGFYDTSPPTLRPKYGCLNISGDIAGVTPARQYGTFFLTMDTAVRYRSTFSDYDTGRKGGLTALATNDYYAHILEQYPDADLQAALTVSRTRGGPSKCRMYKEVQIHGPVNLATDVTSLSVPEKESEATKDLKDLVKAFQKKTNCNILWQKDLLGL